MGHISKTPAGSFRANWRDPAGRQKARTFPTRREAGAFLAEITASLNRGAYVDPRAGKVRFGPYATAWLAGRNDEKTTRARDASIMRTHILPRWADWSLVKIDHTSLQAWITELGSARSPATVAECQRLTSAVMRSAVRDRLIGANPCEGVKVPPRRRTAGDDQTISRDALVNRLLPQVPDRYRALVALAAGAGLRWGECIGLRWDAVELDVKAKAGTVRVIRVAVEVAGIVSMKQFPKSRAGRRTVPLPAFVVELLAAHRDRYASGPAGEVFTNTAAGPPRRTLFRARVWRPALVRAGLLGSVQELAAGRYRALWRDASGVEHSRELPTKREAVTHAARNAARGLRFHDLRHSYATWLVSRGVPVNDVAAVMGHEQTSTTLNRYTHPSRERDQRVLETFTDFSLTEEAN